MTSAKIFKLTTDAEFKANLDGFDAYGAKLKLLFADLTHHRHGEDFGTPTLSVSFTVDAKRWKSLRDQGELGMLYGVDLGNYLSQNGILNEYCVPIVSDRDNARKGRKSIRVEYRLKGHPYR